MDVLTADFLQQYLAEYGPPPPSTNGAAPPADDAHDDVTYEEIEEALRCLPRHLGPNSYEDWLDILKAVHSVLGDAGAELCNRYIGNPDKPNEIAEKFKTFHGSGVTIASLFHFAKQYGYRPHRRAQADEDLPELDDETIAAIVEGRPVEALPFDLYDYRPEDGGILDAWLEHHGDTWLFVTGYENWSFWTGTHWQEDRTHTLSREIANLISAMNRAAEAKMAEVLAQPEPSRWMIEKAKLYIAATKRTNARITSVMGMARGFRAAPAATMNMGPVLNLANGTLDLESFTLRPHDPADLITYCLPYAYDPDATAPVFESVYLPGVFVDEETLDPDPALMLLCQELVGYSLTADTAQEVMVWMVGEGGNGKTVLIELLKALLGPLATSVDFQTIGLPGNYDLAKLPGMRVALSTESERGGTVAEGYVKRIVSGETMAARAIYGAPFEFKSTAKIWWAMNDKPVIKSTSKSMWRRLKMLPFYRTFDDDEKDPHLLAKLLNELPGILNWALDGLRRLRERGRFTYSAAAESFLREYEEESNPVGLWLNERTLPAPEPVTPARGLYTDYVEWCKESGRQPLNETNFGREMKRLRIQSKRASSGMQYARVFNKENDIAAILGL